MGRPRGRVHRAAAHARPAHALGQPRRCPQHPAGAVVREPRRPLALPALRPPGPCAGIRCHRCGQQRRVGRHPRPGQLDAREPGRRTALHERDDALPRSTAAAARRGVDGCVPQGVPSAPHVAEATGGASRRRRGERARRVREWRVRRLRHGQPPAERVRHHRAPRGRLEHRGDRRDALLGPELRGGPGPMVDGGPPPQRSSRGTCCGTRSRRGNHCCVARRFGKTRARCADRHGQHSGRCSRRMDRAGTPRDARRQAGSGRLGGSAQHCRGSLGAAAVLLRGLCRLTARLGGEGAPLVGRGPAALSGVHRTGRARRHNSRGGGTDHRLPVGGGA
ncbi:unannotated protein [freshwater metagenome]|uniref:Unannotated protein n=1 Tax=freshwater metagenome TaxID=449393 RepID=A0A6J6RGM8_9ZZZZ